MKHLIVIVTAAAIALALPAMAETVSPKTPAAKATAGFKTDKDRISYVIGYQFAQGALKRPDLDLNPRATAQAVQDVLSGAKPKLSPEEMQTAMQTFQKQMAEKRATLEQRNLESSQAFLEANKKKDGVVVRDSGLQYKVLTGGNGKQPKAGDTVTVHYRGTLVNGTEFDSSLARGQPYTFPLNNVIRGWQEALPLMKEGTKWQVFIPPDLAYGTRGAGAAIGPNEALIFEIELIKVGEGEASAPPKG